MRTISALHAITTHPRHHALVVPRLRRGFDGAQPRIAGHDAEGCGQKVAEYAAAGRKHARTNGSRMFVAPATSFAQRA